MINAKKLLKQAKKWKNLAALKGKKITLPQKNLSTDKCIYITSQKPEKGCFVVYSFLYFLTVNIIKQTKKMILIHKNQNPQKTNQTKIKTHENQIKQKLKPTETV